MFILELYFPKISVVQILHLNLAFDTKLPTGQVDEQKSSPIIQRTFEATCINSSFVVFSRLGYTDFNIPL